MELLDEELRRTLPWIRKFHNSADDEQRMVFAKFFARRTDASFYVAKGEQRHTDYVLSSLLITPQYKFPLRFQITLGQLRTEEWLGEERRERDYGFQPATWGAVERTIPPMRRPLDQAPPLSSKALKRFDLQPAQCRVRDAGTRSGESAALRRSTSEPV